MPGIVLLLILAALMILTGCAICLRGRGTKGKVDWIVVLGMKVDGTEPTPMLRDRINGAYAYLSLHPHTIGILSGYQSGRGEISEAECMHRELVALGIEPARLWIEPMASTTEENIMFALALIEAATGCLPRKLGIVSSEVHLFRAGMFARAQGVETELIPAKTTKIGIYLLHLFREIILVWYYSIKLLRRKRT